LRRSGAPAIVTHDSRTKGERHVCNCNGRLVRPSSTTAQRAKWILVDALVSGSAGVLLLAGSPFVEGTLGLRRHSSQESARSCSSTAALVGLARLGAPASGVAAVVAGNTLWVAASVIVALADWLTFTDVGTALTLLQAGVVAVLAELQLLSLRRSR
jgi:hypothetical protein